MELEERKKKKLRIALAFQQALDTENGKIVLEELSRMCKENEPTYVDHNPNGTAYNEGQRSIIIGIRKMLEKNTKEIRQESAKL